MKNTTSAILATALLIGASSSANSETEFYYQTYGGFIEGSAVGSVTDSFREGQVAATDDGVWEREGPFSKLVQFGDQNNKNENESARDKGGFTTWPALTWGHPPADPWISSDPEKGGASGVGVIGYGYKHTKKKEGRKIVVGKDDVLYPFGALQHHNYPIFFAGSIDVRLSWNLEIYDKKGNLLHNGHYLFNLYQWETVNYAETPIVKACPQTYLSANSPMTDTAFNQMQKDIDPYWPVTGLDDLYYGDGGSDKQWCADAFGYEGSEGMDHFSVFDKKGKVKNYTITFEGFYDYHAERDGCPELGALYGVPQNDTDESWALKCFEKNPTFWSEERSSNTGWVRMGITEDTQPSGTSCKEQKPIDKLALRWQGPETIEKINVWFSEVGKGNKPAAQTIIKTIAPGDLFIVEGLSEDNPKDIVLELIGENGPIGNSMFHISCSEEDLNGPEDCGKTVGSGIGKDPTLIKSWTFEGMSGAAGNPTDFCEATSTP